jgi:hypothetical protein
MKNGKRVTAKGGFVQRLVCSKCGLPGKTYEHDPGETRLQALALLAMRLPLDQAENLTALKSETISKHLMSVLADRDSWAACRKRLLLLGVSEDELQYLHSCAHIASLTNRCAPGFGPVLKGDLPSLKARIESVIRADIVIAPSRQGVHVCRKKDFDDFIRNIGNVPIETLKSVRLTRLEWKVLEQLRQPARKAQLLARIYGGAVMQFDPVTMKVLPSKLTPLESLAASLNMPFERFKGIVIALVRKLRKLVDRDSHGYPGAQPP